MDGVCVTSQVIVRASAYGKNVVVIIRGDDTATVRYNGAETTFSASSSAMTSNRPPLTARPSVAGGGSGGGMHDDSMFDADGLPISTGPVKASKSRNGRPQRCACKNSKCLKLYCDCFSVGQKCDGCSCNDCHNTDAFQDDIDKARKSVIKRNPKAFAAKFVDGQSGEAVIQTNDKSSKHARGCNCSKSRCVKNYCECWQMGITCSEKCKCVNCANGKPETTETRKQPDVFHLGLMKLADSWQ